MMSTKMSQIENHEIYYYRYQKKKISQEIVGLKNQIDDLNRE